MFKQIIIVIFLIFPFYLFSQTNTSERLFIKTFDAKKGITKEFAEKLRDKLTLYFFQEQGNKYRILNDSDVKVMFQQAEKLLTTSCNAEECLLQIAYILDTDILIHGSIENNNGKIHIFCQSLKRNRKSNTLDKISIVDTIFNNSQIDWYAKEIVKKLVNPQYIINEEMASPETKFEFQAELPKINNTNSFDIQVLEFNTDDSSIEKILDYLKALIKEGDELFKKEEFINAFEKYDEVITKIETKLPLVKQSKMAEFKTSVQNRITTIIKIYYNTYIDNAEILVKLNKFEEALQEYKDLNRRFECVASIYKNQITDIEKILQQRIAQLSLTVAQYYEKQGDVNYADYEFTQSLEKYNNSLILMDQIKLKDKSRQNYQQKLFKKTEIVKKTSLSYFQNIMQAYFDRIDFYNVKEMELEAKSNLEELRKFIIKNHLFSNKKMIAEFNEKANMLKAGELYMLEIPIPFCKDNKWGLMDQSREIILKPTYDWLWLWPLFSEGLAAVGINNKVGFINTSGQEVIPLKYDNVSFFKEGLCAVTTNDKLGYINKKGN